MAIPWRTLLMALPQRRFTPAALRRANPEPPGSALCTDAVFHAPLLAAAVASPHLPDALTPGPAP